MCGFVVTRTGALVDESRVRRRGPDGRGSLALGGFDFVHYLLHITGEKLLQPFRLGDIVCVFNGEIYNRPFERSDGEVIIPLYQKHGVDFARELDGEYAIALYDLRKRIAVFATDPFATKPLFVRGVECASYESALPGATRLAANTTLVRPLDGGEDERRVNFPFDFANQTKDSYDDWASALSKSVGKRAKDGCFVTLSSGFDSGVVSCELLRRGTEFSSYAVRAAEHLEVLTARVARTNGTLLHMSVDDYEIHTRFLREHCEHADFLAEAGVELHCDYLFQDPGAVGSSFIYSQARARGQRVHLSGHGGDEIYSDYSHLPEISSLKGSFPRDLAPWRHFVGGCMRAYLAKEEFVAGAYGIETRYPLLDAALVQEFLWLTPELKNKSYKAPLRDFMQRHEFPYCENFKTGFSAQLNLTPANDERLPKLFSWRKKWPAQAARSNGATSVESTSTSSALSQR